MFEFRFIWALFVTGFVLVALFFFLACIVWIGARLPLYTFKKVASIGEKDVTGHECSEPPVAFLDSLLLGQVQLFK